jgi:hypothetical protein
MADTGHRKLPSPSVTDDPDLHGETPSCRPTKDNHTDCYRAKDHGRPPATSRARSIASMRIAISWRSGLSLVKFGVVSAVSEKLRTVEVSERD